VVVLYMVQCFAALVLVVTLYAITREQDRDLAMSGPDLSGQRGRDRRLLYTGDSGTALARQGQRSGRTGPRQRTRSARTF